MTLAAVGFRGVACTIEHRVFAMYRIISPPYSNDYTYNYEVQSSILRTAATYVQHS